MFVFDSKKTLRTTLQLVLVGLSAAGLSSRVLAEESRRMPQTDPAPVIVSNSVSEPILLWKGTAPGDTGDIGEEKDTTPDDPNVKPEARIIRLTNVTRPTIAVYHPPKDKDTGAAVIVCPGGGYSILAYDLEGSEVCKWLNTIGVTGVLLKYRVPSRKGLPVYTAALQDGQRAIGIVRHRAKEWGIDPSRIGVLGFSAGGHLSAAVSTNYDSRTYPVVDDSDKESSRPDFTLLIYPAYLISETEPWKLAHDIKVTEHTPHTFIVQTEDDTQLIRNSFTYGWALRDAKVPMEMHIYPTGGHGYGLRPSANSVSHWPQLAEVWMKSQGFLTAK